MKTDTDGRGWPSLEELVVAAYDDLRERVRAMSRGAPPTLAGTAGLHAALERILRGRVQFRDRRHFTAYCLFLIRRLWISHWRASVRRSRRDAQAVLSLLSVAAGEPSVPAGDEVVAVLELLERLRTDPHVARRRRIARAVECHLVAGFTQAETAEILGESKAMVQQRIAFFLAWARLAIAPDVHLVERAIAEVELDRRLSRGDALAAAARRFYLAGEPRGAIAAALGVPAARVDQDLRLFAAWVAAREAKGGARAGGA